MIPVKYTQNIFIITVCLQLSGVMVSSKSSMNTALQNALAMGSSVTWLDFLGRDSV
jgi:hypothetical protein